MSLICGKCEIVIDRRKTPAMSCSGFCSKSYHATCTEIPPDVVKHMKTPGIPGLYWYCEYCSNKKSDFENVVKITVETKLKDAMNNIEKLFEDTRKEILKIADEKLSNISMPTKLKEPAPLYSQVVDNKSMVIIKPKNSEQPNAQTKSDIMNNLNPIDLNIHVSKVKNLSNGGILIGCNSSSGADKLKQVAKVKLSTDYNVKDASRGSYRLKIVGMIEEYTAAQIVKFINHQNDMFSDSSNYKVCKIWPTKKNNRVYQALLDVEAETYCKVMEQGHLFVNYDVCTVYDAIDLKLCYKCCGFNHYEKTCSSNILVCPKCSRAHNIKDCSETSVPRCINCVNAKIDDNNHVVWDSTKCTVYKKKLTHLRETLFDSK